MQAARHMPCMRGACSLSIAVLQNCTISVVSNSKEQLCSTTLLAASQEVAQLQLRSGHAHKSTHKHMRTTAYINSSQARTHAAAHHWQGTALPKPQTPLKATHSPTVKTRRLQRLHGSTAGPNVQCCASVVSRSHQAGSSSCTCLVRDSC